MEDTLSKYVLQVSSFRAGTRMSTKIKANSKKIFLFIPVSVHSNTTRGSCSCKVLDELGTPLFSGKNGANLT
jgi:hypothetical protein